MISLEGPGKAKCFLEPIFPSTVSKNLVTLIRLPQIKCLSLSLSLLSEGKNNAGLGETQAGIKIAGRNINKLRYADDTTLMAESEEELKSLLDESERGE